MGIIHTKLRNRLAYERVRDTAVLKIALRRAQEEAGATRNRLKRKLGLEDAATEGHVDDFETVTSEEVEFVRVVEEMISEAEEETDNESDVDMDEPGQSIPTERARQFEEHTQKMSIPLKDLFVYPSPPEGMLNGLDMYWPEGERSLQQELEFYELIVRDSAPSADVLAMVESMCIT